jgi:hypothetical protein
MRHVFELLRVLVYVTVFNVAACYFDHHYPQNEDTRWVITGGMSILMIWGLLWRSDNQREHEEIMKELRKRDKQ